MSKVSFRARALDASRPLPVYRDRDCPDLRHCVSISRSVPQLPSGMDTEEEQEHHLQRALSAQRVFRDQNEQLVIPVPEAETNTTYYDRLYQGHVPVPKQLIHIQPPGPEQPDYDLDSEDETLMNRLNRKVDVRPLQFENMMERLEKNSTHQLVSLNEAKQLLSEEDYLLMSVYDHWVRKRRTCGHPSLIPHIKQDGGDRSSNSDAYVAFRRRTEKMQTRKNRKNDEASYKKMVRLRREFSRTVSILDMIRRREMSKRELLLLTLEVLERRYQMFLKDSQVSLCLPLLDKPVNCSHETDVNIKKKQVSLRDKLPFDLIRPKKKNMRRDRWYRPQRRPCPVSGQFTINMTDITQYDFHSSGDEDEDSPSPAPSPPRPLSSSDEDSDADGVFVFRRRAGCQYLSPCVEQTGGAHHPKLLPQCLRHSLTKLTPHWTGLSCRRIGRGGRIILDRASSGLDPVLRHMDSLIGTRTWTWLFTDPVRLDQGLDQDLDQNMDLDPSLTKLLNNIQTLRRFCYRPRPSQDQRERGRRTPETRTGPSGITEEQYHCQQLLQMQKQQLEQLHISITTTAPHRTQSSRSSDTSLKTLDSSSAQFAGSADARPRPHHGHMTSENKPYKTGINRLHPPSGPSRPLHSSSPQSLLTQRSQVGVLSPAHPHTAPPSAPPASALKLAAAAAAAAASLNQVPKNLHTPDQRLSRAGELPEQTVRDHAAHGGHMTSYPIMPRCSSVSDWWL